MGRTSINDALLKDIAERLREEGREEAKNFFQPIITEKDREIERLNLLVKELQSKKNRETKLNFTYNYNASCFNYPNGDTVIDALIELAEAKREKGYYVIIRKTDWFMVWKVLHYFKIYCGSEYEFIVLVNECVLPNVKDEKRRKDLAVNDSNFKTIKNDSPMKLHSTYNWRRELAKEREARANETCQHGTLALERGVNIMVSLQKLLQKRGVDSINFEK